MKVRFCVCARNLPNAFGNFATLSCNGEEFGRTEVIRGSPNPLWKKVFVLECENIEETNVVVAVLSNVAQEEIGRRAFNVAEILGRGSKVLYEELEGGGTIYVHAAENSISRCTFKFQICGQDLVNVSRARFLTVTKSDPFYELQSTSGDIIYRSEVKDENLNPDWLEAQVDLESLCDGEFGAPVKFTIFDQDQGEKHKLMGSFDTSVNGLVVAAATDESIAMTKDGENTGQIWVLQADYIGFVSPWQVLRAAASARDLSVATSLVAQAKSQAAEVVQKKFEKARLYAEARRKSEQDAAQALLEAQEAAEKAKTESQNAANEAERIRKAGLFGTLKFQFVGKKLKNVDFGLWDKSDPFFVLQKVASEESDGKVEWSHVFISDVRKNKLNPVWKVSQVNVGFICQGNLDERLRVVVFDWERSGRHKLIGYFETSVNGILSAQRSAEEFQMMNGRKETGRVLVQYAELIDFVDLGKVERKAKVLANKADEARFFVLGSETKAKLAKKRAKTALNNAQQTQEEAEAATEEAAAAQRQQLERTVTKRLEELGLEL